MNKTNNCEQTDKRNGLNRRIRRKKTGIGFLWKLIFGRTLIIVLMILLQIYLLFVVAAQMGQYSQIGFTLLQILSVFVVIYIINCKENPAFKMAWIIPVCAFPVFGTLLFLFIQLNPGNYKLKLKLERRIDETIQYSHTSQKVAEALKQDGGDIEDMSYYIEHINFFPTYGNTQVTYFALGEDKYVDLLRELEKAEKFIFIEYFIIESGYMWNHILEVLERKAIEGVEVRVMYDGTCTLLKLPYNYESKLENIGIKAKTFLPIKPLLSTHQNNRDHRKLLIIDGKVAYVGGINLADEYINEIELFGHWKDVAVRLNGDAVRSYTLMFLQMWNVSEKGEENYGKYLVETVRGKLDKKLGFVIPYNDDPTNRQDVAERVYLDILNKAKKYVHIMTPYLILDNEMVVALSFAAQRGIDVKLILPHVPDKKIVFYIARTYYKQLLEAGVKIYEYTPGFLHAKLFVSDDEKAVVGSINLDFRSLYQHFECAAYIYKNPVIDEIEKDYQETLEKSQLITMQNYKKISVITRVLGHIFRLFGPLM